MILSFKKKPTPSHQQCPSSSGADQKMDFVDGAVREADIAKTIESLRSHTRLNRTLADSNQHRETTAYYTLARKIPPLAYAAEREFSMLPTKVFKDFEVFRSLKGTDYVIQKRWGNWTYNVVNSQTQEPACLRVEPIGLPSRMPNLYRQLILNAMSDEPNRIKSKMRHFLDIIEQGTTLDFNYIIVETANCSIWDFRARVMNGADFSPSTAAQIGVQILQAINDAFRCNIVSRYIHPKNFYMGRRDSMHIIFMIDCSMGFIQTASRHRYIRGDVTPANQTRYPFLDYRFMPKCYHTKSEYTIFDEIESFIYVFYDLWTQYNPLALATSERESLITKECLLHGLLPPEYGYIVQPLSAMLRFNDDERKNSSLTTPDFTQYLEMAVTFFQSHNAELNETLDWLNNDIVNPYIKRRKKEKILEEKGQKQPFVDFNAKHEPERIRKLIKEGIIRPLGCPAIRRVNPKKKETPPNVGSSSKKKRKDDVSMDVEANPPQGDFVYHKARKTCDSKLKQTKRLKPMVVKNVKMIDDSNKHMSNMNTIAAAAPDDEEKPLAKGRRCSMEEVEKKPPDVTNTTMYQSDAVSKVTNETKADEPK